MLKSFIARLRSYDFKVQTALFGLVAFVSLFLTMLIMSQHFLLAVKVSGFLLVPLGLAVAIVHRLLIQPARRKLARVEEWPRPKAAAITAGIVIAISTVVLMQIIVGISSYIWQIAEAHMQMRTYNAFELAKQNFFMTIYLGLASLAVGVVAWLPLGILQGYLLLPHSDSRTT